MSATQTEESTQRHFNRIKAIAKTGYDAALHAATQDHRVTVNHSKLGPGYIVTGSIAGFIRQGSQDKIGKAPSKSDIEYARKFLRLSHNVVSIERVDTYTFKIFVREKWNDYDAALPMVYTRSDRSEDWYERKVTPDEAGETMPPGEVTTKPAPYKCEHCEMGFETNQRLAVHVRHYHPDKPSKKARRTPVNKDGKALCPYCGWACNPRGIKNHTRFCVENPNRETTTRPAHKQKNEKGSEVSTWTTDTSLPESFRPPNTSFDAHQQWDTERQAYVCPLCDRDFLSPLGIRRHKESHLHSWAKWLADEGIEKLLGEQTKHEANGSPTVSDPTTLDDEALLDELRQRLAQPQESEESKRIQEEHRILLQRHGVIKELLADVNKGNLAPLKALSEIEAALDL